TATRTAVTIVDVPTLPCAASLICPTLLEGRYPIRTGSVPRGGMTRLPDLATRCRCARLAAHHRGLLTVLLEAVGIVGGHAVTSLASSEEAGEVRHHCARLRPGPLLLQGQPFDPPML